MNKQSIQLAMVMCCIILGLLYAMEWVTKAGKTQAAKSSAAQVTVTNAMSPNVRAGIMVALEHVRTEIDHTTNATDLSVLRAAEASLTNVLSRP